MIASSEFSSPLDLVPFDVDDTLVKTAKSLEGLSRKVSFDSATRKQAAYSNREIDAITVAGRAQVGTQD